MTDETLALLYARKSSTDERKQSGADSESVGTQLASGRAAAEKDGCTVAGEYKDDAISGGEFERRPGLAACRERAIKLARDGQRVRIYGADQSRFGRHRTRTAVLLEELIEENVEVWSYHTGRIAWPGMSEEEFLMSQIRGYGDVKHRKDSSWKTRHALAAMVEQGNRAVGGDCYGYRRKAIYSEDGQTYQHTILVIEDDEARTLRGVFKMKARGHGYGAIAKTLNGDPAYQREACEFFRGETPPSPGHAADPARYGNPHTWCPTCIRSMLYRERYRGVVEWGVKQNFDRKGATRKRRKADPAAIVRKEVPELRIIDEELWRAAHKQLHAVRANYTRKNGGQFWLGRVESGAHSRHLLSGLLRCKHCGASMVATTFTRSGKSVARYACSHNSRRGVTACANNHRPFITEIDSLILRDFEERVLTEANIEGVAREAEKQAAQRRQERPDEAARLRAEIGKLEVELNRYLDLVAQGRAPESVLERIRGAESRLKAQQEALAAYSEARVVNLEQESVRRRVGQSLARFRELLSSRHTPKMRQVLRKLLGGNVFWFERLEDGYRITGETLLGAVLEDCGAVYGAQETLPKLHPLRIVLV